jgi:DNA-binding LytR/AlgR family response regulator
MSDAPPPTALIAEDEPLLAMALRAELGRAWPVLQIVGDVRDGDSAVAQALALRPALLFLDIRMPGQSGLEAAQELAHAWPDDTPFPLLVFVTAYDQYAVQAFEAQAVDYLVKPIDSARLRKCVDRLQSLLAQRRHSPANADAGMDALRQLLAHSPAALTKAPLRVIQASVGSSIHMVPIDDVLVFEAADKYIRVLTTAREYLIRTPLKELLAQLDAQVFWQVHRGTVVRAAAIETVTRDEAGKLSLTLRGRPERLAVSRLYASLFRAM